jgi:hypothetical protein
MLPVREWLVSNIHYSAQFLEHYIVEIPDGTTERLTWTHLSNERALIALLKLGADVTAPEVTQLVQEILSHQVDCKYWGIDTVPYAAPSWAMIEAILSLRLYLDYLERQGSIVALSRTISELKNLVKEQSSRISELESQATDTSLKTKILRFFGRSKSERDSSGNS